MYVYAVAIVVGSELHGYECFERDDLKAGSRLGGGDVGCGYGVIWSGLLSGEDDVQGVPCAGVRTVEEQLDSCCASVGEACGLQGFSGFVQILAALGLYEAKLDGIWGPRTKAALRRFQEKREPPTRGRLTKGAYQLLEGA